MDQPMGPALNAESGFTAALKGSGGEIGVHASTMFPGAMSALFIMCSGCLGSV